MSVQFKPTTVRGKNEEGYDAVADGFKTAVISHPEMVESYLKVISALDAEWAKEGEK